MMACSSSARNPIDRTRSVPVPTRRSSGIILPWRASTSPSIPSRRGTEKPQMSASRIPTTSPRAASATARFTVTDDLPTPPFPEAMASTRVDAATAVSGASSRAFQRARAMTVARSSASMAATSTSTERTHSSDCACPMTSRSIWFRRGQAAIVRATSTVTCPSSTRMPRTIPRSTIVSPSSGSTTARRRSRTSASRPGRDPSPEGVVASVGPGDMTWDSTCVTAFSGSSPRRCRRTHGTGNMALSAGHGVPPSRSPG